MEEQKMKACPNCNSVAGLTGDERDWYEVCCGSCRMQGPLCQTGAEAIAIWNRLTLAPEPCDSALDIATAGETLAGLIPKGWSMTVAGRKE